MTVYKPNPVSFEPGHDFFAETEANWKKLQAIDNQAKAKGQLLYRYVAHAYADGNAVYQIIKVGARTVTIQVVTGIGDDWVLPAWGERTNIKRGNAEQMVRMRDGMDALFADKADAE